jgi:hypothetical protein
MVRGVIFIFLVCFFVACKSKEPAVALDLEPKSEDTLVVATIDTLTFYERTACFGMCPIFKCVILSNGQVYFEGKNFVDRIGLFQTTWNSAALQKIMQMADDINYFSMNGNYNHEHITDLPSVITRLKLNNQDLTIVNRYKGPKELLQLYDVLDELIEQSEWASIEMINK